MYVVLLLCAAARLSLSLSRLGWLCSAGSNYRRSSNSLASCCYVRARHRSSSILQQQYKRSSRSSGQSQQHHSTSLLRIHCTPSSVGRLTLKRKLELELDQLELKLQLEPKLGRKLKLASRARRTLEVTANSSHQSVRQLAFRAAPHRTGSLRKQQRQRTQIREIERKRERERAS